MKGSTSNSALWVTADQRSSERLEEKDVDYSKEPLFFDIPPIQQADAAVRPVKSTRGIPWRRIRESGVIAPDLDLKPPSPIRVVIDIRDKRERKGSKDDGVFAALPPRSGSFSVKSSRDVPGPPKTVEELLGAQWGPQCTGRASSDSETGYVSPSLVEVATTAVTTAAGNKHVNPRFTGDALILRSPRQTRAVLLRREFNARTAREKVLNAFAQSTPRSLPTSKRPSIDLSEEYNAVARRRGAWVGVKGFPAAAATWVGSASCLGWPTGLPPRGKSSASPRTMKSATSLPFDPHSVIERNRECDNKRKVQGSSPYLSAVPSPALRGNCSSKKNTGTATNEHVGGPAPRIASCSIASFDDHFSSTSPRKGTVNNENTGKSLTDWPMTSVARRTNVPYELTSSVDSIDTEEFDYEKCLLQKNDHYATQSHGHPGKNRCKHSLGHDNDSCQLNIVEVSDVTEVDGPTKAGQAGHCRHKMNLSTGSCVPFFRELLDGRGKLQDDTSSIAFETLLEPNAIVGATLSGLQTARRAEPQTTNEKLRDDTSSIAFETLLEPNAIVGATPSGLQTARRAEPQTTNEKLRDDTSSIAFETLLEPNAIVGATPSGLQTARRAEPQTTNEKLRDDTSSIAFETLLEPNAIVGATPSGLQTARRAEPQTTNEKLRDDTSSIAFETLLEPNAIVGATPSGLQTARRAEPQTTNERLRDDTSSIAFEALLEPNAIVGATPSGLQTARRAEPQTTNERLRDDTSSIAFETLLEPNAIVGATPSGLQTARRAEPQTTNEKLRDDTSSIAFETLLEPNAIVGATPSGLQTARRAEPQTTNEKLRDDTSSIAFETLLEPNAIVGATLSGLQTARIITADISEDRCSWVNSTVSLESLSDAGLGTNNIVGDFMTSDVIVDSLGESPQGNSGVRDEVQSESRDTFTGESSLTPRSLKSCFDNGETDSLPPILRSGARSVIVPNSSRVSFSGAGTRKTLSEVRRPSSDNGDGCVISTRSSSPRLWTPSKIRIRGEDILVPRHHRTENKGVRVDSPAGRSVLSTYATLRNRNYLGLMRRYFLTWKGLAKHCTTRTASTIGQSPTTCGSCVDDSSCGFVPTTAVVASLAAAAAAAAPTSSRAHGVNNPHSDPSKIRNLTARSLKLLLGDNYHSADYVYNHLRRKRLGQPRSHYRMVPPDEDDYVSSGSRHRSICSAETSFSYPSDDVTTPISMT
ncbi:hypothetical protein, conserved [Trypanosoma brucei gambiense DAL972]|uniref:T. brucei spp.-specific protein n=1 Tax=Trypanosoma brucei gambiense (strain MHOM/CI/86/DAL972) TaxID=679716 RepID=C9ZWJ6_TRYB9|nr:hypothetical protein, conserved [Trypanosoma brucei gambiense DAL972]CBH13785.1 hypothetical protein, conserved [Trypanosoma brucei gambiense DAL972]|eukprot:XP_011776061.1 hypothetical protein, conserved [Trypanosoma brucei gambiense DAL972]